MTGRRNPRRDERGATLILALAFVVVFGLVTVSVLSFAGSGLKAAGVYVDQGKRGYSADGATQVAIRNFAQGNPCADYTAPPINGQQMIVHCDPLNASPVTARTTQPQDALRSLQDGINVTTPGLRVQGNVFSNSNITTGPGASMVVSGDVSAVGDCSNAVSQTQLPPTQAPYVRDCASNRPAADPDYTPPLTAVPARQTVPTCPAAGAWLVKLQPGYYDDATALNALTDASCPNKVVWLQPGVYYFDFTFTGGPAVWTVADRTVSVVGGTQAGWDSGAPTRPAIPDPGGCDTTQSAGVEVMMGGGSQFQVHSGHVELCAPVNPDTQHVAVYGVQPPKPSHTLKPTAVAENTGFTNTANALTIGELGTLPECTQPTGAAGCTADAVLDPVNRPSASMQLGGFTPQVPPGSVITSATLRVAHEDDGDLTAPGAVTVTTAVGGNPCRTDNLPRHPTLAEDPAIDVLGACGLTDPARFTGLTVTYAATLDTGGTTATERLDGIWLEVAYRTPTTFKPTVVTASAGFSNQDSALEIGEQPPLLASADLSAANPAPSITLAGYGQPPIPAGSTIQSAVLRVAHQETGDAAAPTVNVNAGGGSCTDLPLNRRADLADDRVDLRACGITDAAQITGLTATYRAALTAGGAGTDALDGMWLEIVYDPPPTTRAAISAVATGFTTPAAAEAIDGATADATLAAATPTASISLSGYDTPAVPPGSLLDQAVLHIAHRELPGATGPPPTVAVTVTVTGPGYRGPCTTPQNLAAHPDALTTDTLDLIATCGLTDAAQLTGLTVTYTATLDAGSTDATDQLDGVTLDLAYRPAIAVRPTTADSTTFTNPAAAEAIDGGSSTATLTTATPSASIHLGGFAMLPLPAGAVIDRAVLRVVHLDDAAVATALTVSGTGTACDASHDLTGVEVVDLSACGVRNGDQLSTLAADYVATLGAGSTDATDQLDGVELDIVFRAPSIEALSGCLTAGNGCPVLQSTDAADTATEHTRLIVNGTVYAPTGAVNLSMSQVSSQVVTRGIVGRSIDLGISPAPGYQRPVIGIPPEPVQFTTYPAVIAKPASVTAITGFTPPGTPVDVTDATIPGGGQASLTLGGYAQPPPATTKPLEHAVLRVTHQDDGAESVSITLAVNGTACAKQPVVPVRPGTPVTDQFDVHELCGVNTAVQLAGLTVTYTVTAGSGGATEHLGGTQVDLLSGPLIQAAVSFDGHATTVKQWTVLP